jgi:DHA3 family macrolide efflux protein-like MFS transporter
MDKENIVRQKFLLVGMSTFIIIWLGQTVSLVGSGLTGFALGVWVYQTTGSAMQFALIALFSVLPRIVMSPLAGVLVDRWNRRWAMIIGDSGAGLSTLVIALLFFTNQLEVWHIYLATAINSAFSTLQWPAYSAITPLLVAKENLGRANGMIQFSRAASEILSPTLAGVLVLTIKVQGVILIDFATFLFAVITLLLVRIPRPERTMVKSSQGSLWQEAIYGWAYLKARPGLLGLLFFFAVVNFLWAMLGAVLAPMILSFASADTLGVIVSIAGLGMLTGSLVMSAWGGPKRRVHGILSFELLSGISFILMGLRPSAWLIALGAFTAHLAIAIASSCNQALWQSKVAPEVQGRVFATQQMVTQAAAPLGFLLAGSLADYVFEPLFNVGGPLSISVGQVIGAGPGRGIALLIMVMGLLKLSVSLWGLLYPRIRLVEDELPDEITDKQIAPAVV